MPRLYARTKLGPSMKSRFVTGQEPVLARKAQPPRELPNDADRVDLCSACHGARRAASDHTVVCWQARFEVFVVRLGSLDVHRQLVDA